MTEVVDQQRSLVQIVNDAAARQVIAANFRTIDRVDGHRRGQERSGRAALRLEPVVGHQDGATGRGARLSLVLVSEDLGDHQLDIRGRGSRQPARGYVSYPIRVKV